MTPITVFWCCLPALEKSAAIVCGLASLINPIYIERVIVDELFSLSGEPGSLYRLPLFVWTWGLEPGVVLIDEVPVEVYYFLPVGVLSYTAFWIVGAFSCPCRCEILRFPDPC